MLASFIFTLLSVIFIFVLIGVPSAFLIWGFTTFEERFLWWGLPLIILWVSFFTSILIYYEDISPQQFILIISRFIGNE